MLPVVDVAAYVQPPPAAYFEAMRAPLEQESERAAEVEKDFLRWSEETASGLRSIRDDVQKTGAKNIGDLIRRLEELYEELRHNQEKLEGQAALIARGIKQARKLGPRGRRNLRDLLKENEEFRRLKAGSQAVLNAYEEVLPALVLHRFITPDLDPEAMVSDADLTEAFSVLAEDSLAAAWDGEGE